MITRTPMRALPAFLALLVGVSSATAIAQPADPPRGVQFSPDGALTFVNKDVSGQRYAITREEADGTVTGNVFFEDCRRPKFIVCSPAGSDLELSCAIAPACEIEPCGFSDAFVTDVTLPADFFDVPTEAPAEGGDPGDTTPCPTTARALQKSDDGERIFVNRDVAGQRYAITQFTADRSITGNVFVGPTEPPKFIVCDALGAPSEHRWQCEVSDPCPPAPAECTFGGFSTEVTLPADFFVLDVETTQTANTFETTEATTNVIRVGVSAIPGASAAQVMVVGCPDGGSVQTAGESLTYTDCRVGSLVCSGNGSLSDDLFEAELSCLDLDRDRTFTLEADIEIESTASGPAMLGFVDTEQAGGVGFSLEYDELSVAEGSSGGAQFGTTFVGNVQTYFPGVFSDFTYPFDGSETVVITAFIPSPPGFDTKEFELNLATGELTPLG